MHHKFSNIYSGLLVLPIDYCKSLMPFYQVKHPMRGLHRLHAAFMLWRRSTTEGRFSSVISTPKPSLTTRLEDDQTDNPKLHSENIMNKTCRSKYHLQILLKDPVLILNRNRVISSQSRACQTVSAHDLENFSKC